jgi:HIV Tat-specific factor 1
LYRKLAEWSDDEEEVAEKFATKKSKWAKVVIIKHAFSRKELEDEEEAYLEIKQDMRDVAEKYGTVTNLTLFDLEKDGIVTVRFKEFEEAEQFVEAYNGKRYSERALELSIAEDKPKFKKSSRHEGIELDGEDDSDKE